MAEAAPVGMLQSGSALASADWPRNARSLGTMWTVHRPHPACLAGNSIHDSQAYINFYHACAFPGDILVHGMKEFGTYWPDRYRQELATNATAQDTLPQCQPLTTEDELRAAQACCFTHYPGCTAQDGSNICHGKHCPKNLHWWHPNCTRWD